MHYLMNENNRSNVQKFEHIYKLYFNELYRFAYHYTMSDDAQDIVQETFMKLYNDPSLLQEAVNIRAYLYRMVKNSCVDYFKHLQIRNKHQDQLVDAIMSDASDDEKSEPEVNGKINNCLSQLPEKQKMIISLRLEGKNYQEISEILNITVGTVNTHVNRAYKFIKNNYIVICLIFN